MSLFALVVFATGVPVQAFADDNICGGPFGTVFCAVVRAITPKSPEERMESAVDQADLGALKRLKASDPGDFHAERLFMHAAYDSIGTERPSIPAQRWRNIMDFLCDSISNLDTPDIAMEIGQLADTGQPRARLALEALFAHGASARATTIRYPLACREDARDRCDLLGLLLDHGMDPNLHAPAEYPMLRLALQRNRHGDVEMLVAHGADVGQATQVPSLKGTE